MQRLEFHAMGCNMLAVVDADSPAVETSLASTADRFAAWERTLSRFREDSELMALNASAGRPVRVGGTLWQVLDASLAAAQWTGGLATPMVLQAVQAAGYHRSFDELSGGESGLRQQRPLADWQAVQMDPTIQTVRVPTGAGIDLGGFAKGWAADQAVHALAKAGPALMDAGGDISISSPQASGEPWPIAISAPYGDERDLDLPLLALSSGAVATSGRDYRRLGNSIGHHIIDPRTGSPAETDVLTATVVAPRALQAEAAAKAVLILGSDAGLAWIEAHPPLAALVIVDNANHPVRMSRQFHRFVWSEDA